MNAVTRNWTDEVSLSMKELGDAVLRLKHNPALKALKISRATLLTIPAMPTLGAFERLYGVPIEIDDSLELFKYTPVYENDYRCGDGRAKPEKSEQ